jgi:hypothetical protein
VTHSALRLIHAGATPSNTLLVRVCVCRVCAACVCMPILCTHNTHTQQSDGAYIVDCLTEIYCWVGKSSSLAQVERVCVVSWCSQVVT